MRKLNHPAKGEFYLKETCDIFRIPSSKVLFWEKKGLLNIKRSENDYRIFSFFDHARLSDIIFYKRLGLSLSEIRQLYHMDLQGFSATLTKARERTEEKIRSLRSTQQDIDRRMRLVDTLRALENAGSQPSMLPICGIIPLYDVDAYQYYDLLMNLENFTVVMTFDGQNMEDCKINYDFGLAVSDCSKYENLLFQRKEPQSRYIRFLLKVPFEYDQGLEHYDILPYLGSIGENDGTVRKIIGKYLLTTADSGDGMTYDYFDAYAQLG